MIKKAIKRVVTVLIFMAGLWLIYLAVTDVLRMKWNFTENNGAQQIVRGFYEEPQNSLDVLYLGASTVRNGVAPLVMYRDYGFTGYSRATSMQIPEISWYLLQETLQTQDIKVVVMDVSMLYADLEDVAGVSEKVHEALDFMPDSELKRQLVSELEQTRKIPGEEFVFPLYKYHERWGDLKTQDFTYHSWDKKYPYKGNYPVLKARTFSMPENYMVEGMEAQETGFKIDDDAKEYYLKMIRLCREKGIDFVLLRTPVSNWDWNKHKKISRFAKKNEVKYVDLCLPEEMIACGFDPSTDFADDGKHVNSSGAVKISSYLGAYLSENFDLPAVQDSETKKDWDECCDLYESILDDIDLYRENDFLKYLDYLKKDKYLVMISTRYDTSRYLTEDVKEKIQALGISPNQFDIPFYSYVSVLSDGEVVLEAGAQKSPVEKTIRVDGKKIQLASYSHPTATNISSILLDEKEYSYSESGFNFVVYNKETGMIVSRKSFNTGVNGKAYTNPVYEQSADFMALRDKPLDYLMAMKEDRYLSVLLVCEDSAKYLPGSVNEMLKSFGLQGLKGKYKTLLGAVVQGDSLLSMKMNEEGLITDHLTVGNHLVKYLSTSNESGNAVRITINDYVYDAKAGGLHVVVYDTVENQVVDATRFSWKNNYFCPVKMDELEKPDTYLEVADALNYDVICLYRATDNEILKETRKKLKSAGFDQLDVSKNYIGIRSKDGVIYQEKKGKDMEHEYSFYGGTMTLKTRATKTMIQMDDISYNFSDPGVYTIVYDHGNDCFISVRSWQ